DEAIAFYDAKYTYSLWRPVTAIRAADTDGNPDTEADPSWTPLKATPNHASYPSAHATFSTGSATVLASFFGTDAISFSLSTDGFPGVTRSFDSFSAAAQEAGMSRIWIGYHWSFDITAGNALGQSVGAYVSQNFLLPHTSPPPGGSTESILFVKSGFSVGEETGISPGRGANQAVAASGRFTMAALVPGDSNL